MACQDLTIAGGVTWHCVEPAPSVARLCDVPSSDVGV